MSSHSFDVVVVENIISVYPNPISSNFIIKNKIATRLEICDIFGRVVTSENLDYQTSILERKNISDGIYLFKFFNKSKLISTNKIIFK